MRRSSSKFDFGITNTSDRIRVWVISPTRVPSAVNTIDKIAAKADEMRALAERVTAGVDGISFAGQFWFETEVAFSHQYAEKIDALATGASEGGAEEVRGKEWTGQSIRAGIESADRQSRKTAGGQPGGEPGTPGAGDAGAADQVLKYGGHIKIKLRQNKSGRSRGLSRERSQSAHNPMYGLVPP
jgi:hypothetical protein